MPCSENPTGSVEILKVTLIKYKTGRGHTIIEKKKERKGKKTKQTNLKKKTKTKKKLKKKPT